MADPSNWQSLFQGGLGTRLACTSSSANVAVPGFGYVSQMMITNVGNSTVFIKVASDSSVSATTSCYPLYYGNQLILPISAYVAAITESDTSTILINSGNGAG